MKNELGRLKGVIDGLETKLEVTEFELEDARSKSRTLQGELTASNEAAAKARNEFHEVTRKLSQVEEQSRNIVSDLESQLRTARSQAEKLEHELNAAQAEKADAESRLEATNANHQNAANEYQRQNAQKLGQAESHVQQLQKEVRNRDQQIAARDDEIRKLREQLSMTEAANQILQQAPNVAMDVDDGTEASDEAKPLREQLTATEAQNRALEKKIDDLGKDLQTSKQETMGVRQTLQQERSAARTEVETANGQQRRLQAQVEALESHLQQSKQTQSELDTVCLDLDRARALLQQIADAGSVMEVQDVLSPLIKANVVLIELRHMMQTWETKYDDRAIWERIMNELTEAIIPDETISALRRENDLIGKPYPNLLQQANAVNQRLSRLVGLVLDLMTEDNPDISAIKSQVEDVLGLPRGDEVTDADGPPAQGDDGSPGTTEPQSGQSGPSTLPDSTAAKRPKVPLFQVRKKRRLLNGLTEPTGQSSAPQAHPGYGTSNLGGSATAGDSLDPGADDDWTDIYDDNNPASGPVDGSENNSNSPARPNFADTSRSRPFIFGKPGLAGQRPQPEQRPFTGTLPGNPASDGGGLDPWHGKDHAPETRKRTD